MRGFSWGYRQPNDMEKNQIWFSKFNELINRVQRGCEVFLKGDFLVDCFGRGWSGKYFMAVERVWMLAKKAKKKSQKHIWVLYELCLKIQFSHTTFQPIMEPHKTIYLWVGNGTYC